MSTSHQALREPADLSFGRQRDSEQNTRQYLSFFIEKEEYGIDILAVQEIRGWSEPTLLPNAPNHIKGVVNLRGVIVPVLDFRALFGMPAGTYGPLTVVIILQVEVEGHLRIIGLIVDAVSEVVDVAADKIRPAPDFGTRVGAEFLAGLVHAQERVVILLQAERLASPANLN